MAPCISCGHENTAEKTYCEMCGARLQNAADDDDETLEESLSLMLGLVCSKCDSYNDPGSLKCISCSSNLGDPESPTQAEPAAHPSPAAAAIKSQAPSWMSAPAGNPLATINAMKAVDLSTLKAESSGLVAPSEHPTPAAKPQALTAKPQALAAKPQALAAKPQALTTKPQALAAKPQALAAKPQALAAKPQALAAKPQATPPLPQKPPALAATKACEKCSGEILIDDVFCKLCGHRQGQNQSSASGTLIMRAATVSTPAKPTPQASSTMMMPSLNLPSTPSASASGILAPKGATAFFGAVSLDRFARLLLVKGHTQHGTQWRLQAGKTAIGRSLGAVLFPDDPFLSRLHCELEFRNGELWLLPKPSTNGVFLKMNPGSKEPLHGNDEFVVGTQRMRILPDADRKPILPATDAGETKLAAGILRAQLPILVQRIGTRSSLDETYARPQRLLSMGRAKADVNFPTDPYISTRHAQLTRRDDGSYELHDLNSRNGTFIRVQKERKLEHGTQLMMGEQVMRVEVNTLPQLG